MTIAFSLSSKQVPKVYFSSLINGSWRIVQGSQSQTIEPYKDLVLFNLFVIGLITYFFIRGSVCIWLSVFSVKEINDIKDFIAKETEDKIPYSIFFSHYAVIYDEILGEGSFGVVYACNYFPIAGKEKKKVMNKFACKIISNNS